LFTYGERDLDDELTMPSSRLLFRDEFMVDLDREDRCDDRLLDRLVFLRLTSFCSGIVYALLLVVSKLASTSGSIGFSLVFSIFVFVFSIVCWSG
jgi:hypothetical protein